MKKLVLTAAFTLVGVIAVSAQTQTQPQKPADTTTNKPDYSNPTTEYTDGQFYRCPETKYHSNCYGRWSGNPGNGDSECRGDHRCYKTRRAKQRRTKSEEKSKVIEVNIEQK